MPLSSPSSSPASSSSGQPLCGRFSLTSDEHSYDPLLCGEDASSFSEDDHWVPKGLLAAATTTSSSAAARRDGGDEDDEEAAAAWVGTEADHSLGLGYRNRFRSRSGQLDEASRIRSVAWILKKMEFYQFQPLTAYLAVNYMDRFLSRHALPQQSDGWPVQLLAVACLSLAAKMEETLVPSLLDLQTEDATFVFEPRTIQRMEMLVLDALNWRLLPITPFAFIHFFARKVDPGRLHTVCLVSRATQIILASTGEIEFLGHCPSAVAAAAIACAAREAPDLSSISPESAMLCCTGLTRDGIVNCYQLMQELVLGGDKKKQPRSQILPLLGISASDSAGSELLSSSPSSSPSSSSSPPSSSSSKRRKLNSCHWVYDGMGRRPTEEGDDMN